MLCFFFAHPHARVPQSRSKLTEELTEAQASGLAFKAAFDEKSAECKDRSTHVALLQEQVARRELTLSKI